MEVVLIKQEMIPVLRSDVELEDVVTTVPAGCTQEAPQYPADVSTPSTETIFRVSTSLTSRFACPDSLRAKSQRRWSRPETQKSTCRG